MIPRLLWDDARRVVTGARRLAGYLTSRDAADLGLGEFSAESRTVVPGRTHRYAARLASARPHVSAVILRIEIAAVGAPPGAESYARFARRVVVPPAAPLTVAIEYDWLDAASFLLAGARLAPDELHRAPRPFGAEMAAVTARVLAGDGTELDAATIFQVCRDEQARRDEDRAMRSRAE